MLPQHKRQRSASCCWRGAEATGADGGKLDHKACLFSLFYFRSNYTHIVCKFAINRQRPKDGERVMEWQRHSKTLALDVYFTEWGDSVCQRPQSMPILIKTMILTRVAKNTEWHLAQSLVWHSHADTNALSGKKKAHILYREKGYYKALKQLVKCEPWC